MFGNRTRTQPEDEDVACSQIFGMNGYEVAMRRRKQWLRVVRLAPITAVGWRRFAFAAANLAEDPADQPQAIAASPAGAGLMVVGCPQPAPRRGHGRV